MCSIFGALIIVTKMTNCHNVDFFFKVQEQLMTSKSYGELVNDLHLHTLYAFACFFIFYFSDFLSKCYSKKKTQKSPVT